MNGSSLTGKFKEELSNINRSVREASDAYGKFESTNDRHYLNSAALNIHSFYLGLERIFQHIARELDDDIPEGPTWHKDLLGQMNKTREGIRPAVISDETKKILDEYRRFYHVIHHIYGIELEKELLEDLLLSIEADWKAVKEELNSFLDYLKNS